MFKTRIRYLRGLLADKDADAILITTTPNIFYFTGFRGAWGEPSTLLLIVKEEETILLTSIMEEERVRIETGITPITYPRFGDRNGCLASLLGEDLGVKSLLYDELETQIYEKLKGSMETLQSVGREILVKRSIKSRGEIALMRKAAEITTKVMAEVPDILKPGMTEHRLAAEMGIHALELGAEGLSFPPIVASGERSSLPHGQATGKRIPRDSIVLVDFGIRYRGYCSDYTRIYTVGKPPAKLIEAKELTIRAYERSMAKVIAGGDGRDAFQEAVQAYREEGLDGYFLHSLGHGVGITVHELPSLSHTNVELKENQTVTIEPGIYFPGIGGVRLENTVLVGKEGAESLSPLPF
jgi:Xaa-Pro aminopeptidase